MAARLAEEWAIEKAKAALKHAEKVAAKREAKRAKQAEAKEKKKAKSAKRRARKVVHKAERAEHGELRGHLLAASGSQAPKETSARQQKKAQHKRDKRAQKAAEKGEAKPQASDLKPAANKGNPFGSLFKRGSSVG